MAERLQKILSAAGVASRRKAELLISQGRVLVNGKPAAIGDRADIGVDLVTVDGKAVAAERKRYLALNKPPGYVTTLSDPRGRPKVTDLVNVAERLFPVGRLDYNTEGLLLLTNDGDFTQRIAHPRYEIEKVYVARVAAPLGRKAMLLLRNGVQLEDGVSAPAAPRVLSPDRRTVELTIHEGRNRMVRRMLDAVGSPVTQLTRVRIGPLALGDLPVGRWRELTRAEVDRLVSGPVKSGRGPRPVPEKS